MNPTIAAVLFDKDGTIIDFHRTWDHALGEAIRAAATDAAAFEQVAWVLHYDLEQGRIAATSPFVAESNDVVEALLGPLVDLDTYRSVLARTSVERVAPAVGLPGLFADFTARGVRLAVVTNDDEPVARHQIDRLGWGRWFDHIVGCDSGFGAKPEPGMVHGALGLLGVAPANAVIVGDSTHDLVAGRSAGVRTVLVTNGSTPPSGAVDLADHVIESLDELVAALDR